LLFKIVDSNCDGGIGGVDGALFLSRSGLSRDILREVTSPLPCLRPPVIPVSLFVLVPFPAR
jgi:hypothetical protein